jgi:hypothetical protein
MATTDGSVPSSFNAASALNRKEQRADAVARLLLLVRCERLGLDQATRSLQRSDSEPPSGPGSLDIAKRQKSAPPPRKVPKWLVRPFASFAAVFMNDVRLPVANAGLKRHLGWEPAIPSFRSVLSILAVASAAASSGQRPEEA